MTNSFATSPAPFAGEVAVVTGASRGIGQAIAMELARRGFDLGLVQRGEAADTVEAVEALGRRAHVVRADLGDPEAAAPAVDAVAEWFGRLDVAVANAGTIHREDALDVSLADFRRIVDLNLVSVFAVSRAAARQFLARSAPAVSSPVDAPTPTIGRIVHIASILSFQGGVNVCSYAASKGGIVQLTQALANEWAPLGIRVNALAPGYIANDQTAPLRADPERYAALNARIPAGRWGTCEDAARAVAFLVSPDAAYVHGAVLAADGGWLGR
jgi:2-deoxy-D-gluconate 3-dehydrogenase